MAAVTVLDYVSVDVNVGGDVVLIVNTPDGDVRTLMSTSAALKLANTLQQAAKVAEGAYAAQIKRARLEKQLADLRAREADLMARLG